MNSPLGGGPYRNFMYDGGRGNAYTDSFDQQIQPF